VTGASGEAGATSGSGLVSHLLELRTRLLRAVLAVVAGFVVLLPFANASTFLVRRAAAGKAAEPARR
jgi:Sec-independent protein secretion pathway component TatC